MSDSRDKADDSIRSAQSALDQRFARDDHDPLNPHCLLWDEVRQRRETGYDVDGLVGAANELDSDDTAAILNIVDQMADASRGAWTWEEPDTLEEIDEAAAGGAAPRSPDVDRYADQVQAAWLGRIAGCNLGKPIEWGERWPVDHIERYLRQADAYPLTDYIPVLDPMPSEFEMNESWPHSTRGRIDGSARDDDIDYSILALHLLETHGAAITPAVVGQAWTTLLPLRQMFSAERAAYINLAKGLAPPDTARFRNPYREWIGAQIRGDVFGYVHPGDPVSAARVAYGDATLSHTGNGIYGEMWSAALVAAAFTAESAREAVEIALTVVPRGSRLAEAVQRVLDSHAAGASWHEARAQIDINYGHYFWVHSVNNAAVVVLGLLWGEGDFTTSVGGTVMAGLDTDSNGATVGSVAGILAGTRRLPDKLIAPLRDTTRSALFGFDHSTISLLAERTVTVATNLASVGGTR